MGRGTYPLSLTVTLKLVIPSDVIIFCPYEYSFAIIISSAFRSRTRMYIHVAMSLHLCNSPGPCALEASPES